MNNDIHTIVKYELDVPTKLEMWNRVYDTKGLSPCLVNRGGGYETPKIVIDYGDVKYE